MKHSIIPNPFERIEVNLVSIKNELEEFKSQVLPALTEKQENAPSLVKYITKRQAAKTTSLSMSTIDNLRREGKLIPYYVKGAVRFKLDQVLEYMESRKLERE